MDIDNKSSVMEAEENSDGELHISCWRNDALMAVFEHLNFNDVCRAGRVCRKWYEVSRNEDFFKKVLACIKTQHPCLIPQKTFNLIRVLPPYVTHLNLSFEILPDYWFIDFVDFAKEVRERFPCLKTIILRGVKFQVYEHHFHLLMELPESVQVLVLHESHFMKSEKQNLIEPQNFLPECLDVSNCVNVPIPLPIFFHMPRLKKLRFAWNVIPSQNVEPFFGNIDHFHTDSFFAPLIEVVSHQLQVLDLEFTMISSLTFRIIRNSCIQLNELYVCFTGVTDSDLKFDDQEIILPHLVKICLRNCQVTSNGITSFMKVCPSVRQIYVGSKDIFSTNNFSECKSEKVKVLNGYKHCYHYKSVDYMSH